MNATTEHQWRSDGDPAGHMSYCAWPTHSLVHACSADELQAGNSEAWLADHPEATKIGIGGILANGATVLAVKPYNRHATDVVFLALWHQEFATWVGRPDGSDTYWGHYYQDITEAVSAFNQRGVAR